MALYEPKKATLGGVEGAGFAFSRKTYAGKEFQGVFFNVDEDASLDDVLKDGEIVYSGIVYDRSRKKYESFPVNVQKVVKVHAGERVDFEVPEKP